MSRAISYCLHPSHIALLIEQTSRRQRQKPGPECVGIPRQLAMTESYRFFSPQSFTLTNLYARVSGRKRMETRPRNGSFWKSSALQRGGPRNQVFPGSAAVLERLEPTGPAALRPEVAAWPAASRKAARDGGAPMLARLAHMICRSHPCNEDKHTTVRESAESPSSSIPRISVDACARAAPYDPPGPRRFNSRLTALLARPSSLLIAVGPYPRLCRTSNCALSVIVRCPQFFKVRDWFPHIPSLAGGPPHTHSVPFES
jgi:hypothetical protein